MAETYTIRYQAENTYEHPVIEATWQFLIVPEENETQTGVEIRFENSAGAPWELSTNGFGFAALRVRNRYALQQIRFEASFRLTKTPVNPFDFQGQPPPLFDPETLGELPFRIAFATFLKETPLTCLPKDAEAFCLQPGAGLLENLQALNTWVYQTLQYTPGVTHVGTTLKEILDMRKGVCQDFSHLFIGIARRYGVPARYVSGYLHQGRGFFGDAQMHAWAEAWLPGLGWVGFDPTNNLLAATDHIKVAHGRDYEDCAPIKGILFGPGSNESRHAVEVQSQQ
ncbi:transglutaminase family protein [Robiginitalea sp. M366]|uniref:transglutaminase-like domain-containing protein n=1 Tax=Robiginitalea aestuariiviva TaxID=3036903 RepID=UPI00240D3CD0|nr:transglutaminase family protein [Robiginitalea aestuariiviva]MDG1573048.1 transglutaminase family protein [Robiginitalea aestuariiviva]